MTKAPDHSCVCFICHRRADGVGFGFRKWICDDESIKIAKALSKMSRQKIDKYEALAIEHAIPINGAWIDENIGSMDMATWTIEQVQALHRQVITQNGVSMRIVCAELEAPF
jgi:hypothetical protein